MTEQEQEQPIRVFTFRKGNEIIYQGRLKPARCILCSKDCTLHVEFCNDHLKTELKLEVKVATDPTMGLGLFAFGKPDEIVFAPAKAAKKKQLHGQPPPQQRIAYYNGQVLTNEQYAERFNGASGPFGMYLNKDHVVDAALIRGVCCYINHTSVKKANCKFSPSNGKVAIVATTAIFGGTEIFANYNITRGSKQYSGFFSEGTSYSTDIVDSVPDVYCYCQKPSRGFYVKCSGTSECWHSRGWVHPKCAGLNRKHLPKIFMCKDCLADGVKPATKDIDEDEPETKGDEDEDEEEEDEEEPKEEMKTRKQPKKDEEKWCYCQKKDTGEVYLQCAGGAKCTTVNGWVHAKCAGMTDTEATTLKGDFFCKYCSCDQDDEGEGQASFKLARHFTINGHEQMVNDKVRNTAFSAALACTMQQLRRIKKSGVKRAFDVGTGPFAFLAMLAVEHGFKASGIEADQAAAKRAQSILMEKGGRVAHLLGQSHQAASLVREFNPDVVLCELVGFLASSEGMPMVMHNIKHALGHKVVFLPQKIATRFTVSFIERRGGNEQKAFALVKRLDFEKVSMCTEVFNGGLMEEYDFSQDFELKQKHKFTFYVVKDGIVNSLTFWIRVDFPPQGHHECSLVGFMRSYSTPCACGGGTIGQPHFTSRHKDPHAASNWHNMVLWLPEPLDVTALDQVQVECGVNAREFPTTYTFDVVHNKKHQQIVISDLYA